MMKLRRPTIYNVTLTNGTTEYSQALPANVRAFALQARGAADVLWAHEAGKVAGASGTATAVAPYMTLKSGGAFWADNIEPEGALTVYLASASSDVVVEIAAWSW